VVAAAELPSNCGTLALKYIGLFRPGKRKLSAARTSKLIREVVDLINAETIKLAQQESRVPAHIWERALNVVLDKESIQRPLKNHNFLIKVALNLVNQYESMPDEDVAPVVTRKSSGFVAAATVLKGKDTDNSQAKEKLLAMSVQERAGLYDMASDKLVASGIAKNLIIQPMLEGMALSIIMGNA